MEAGNGTAGYRNEHKGPNRKSLRMFIGKMLKYLRNHKAVREDSDAHTDCHRNQTDTENRINLTDNLINRTEGCN